MKIRLLAAAVLAFAAPGASAQPPLQAPAGFLYFGDCDEQTVLLNYSASQFAGLLPPGFAFPGNGRRASVHVSGSSCAVGSEGRPSNELIAFVEVVPPVAPPASKACNRKARATPSAPSSWRGGSSTRAPT